jgi:hypothetical protein
VSVSDRDLVIRALADSEGELLDQIVALTSARDAYRLLAQQAIHALHAVQVRERRLHDQLTRLRDAYRATRRAAA